MLHSWSLPAGEEPSEVIFTYKLLLSITPEQPSGGVGDELDEDEPQSAPVPTEGNTPNGGTSGCRLLNPGEERLLIVPFSR